MSTSLTLTTVSVSFNFGHGLLRIRPDRLHGRTALRAHSPAGRSRARSPSSAARRRRFRESPSASAALASHGVADYHSHPQPAPNRHLESGTNRLSFPDTWRSRVAT